MRHTIITLIAAATIAGCLETEDRPIEDKAFAVSRCDEAGACGSGEVCVEGLCREACADDSMCSDGGFCLDGLCWADAGDACAADADCAAGDLCVEGVCAPAAELLDCAADADCPASSICVDRSCVYDGDSDCTPEAEICDELDNDCDGEVDEECFGTCAADFDCPHDSLCVDGACLCGEGLTTCPLGCVDLQADAADCGACGHACDSGERCVDGDCQS
jgi:hypothetical protein